MLISSCLLALFFPLIFIKFMQALQAISLIIIFHVHLSYLALYTLYFKHTSKVLFNIYLCFLKCILPCRVFLFHSHRISSLLLTVLSRQNVELLPVPHLLLFLSFLKHYKINKLLLVKYHQQILYMV